MPVYCPDCKAIWGDMQYICRDYDLSYKYRDGKRATFYKCPVCSLIFYSSGDDCSMDSYNKYKRYNRVSCLEYDLLDYILMKAFVNCGERYRMSDFDW
jgi:hypothetical protein